MNLAILKTWLLSRLFLSSTGIFLLLTMAIAFNWMDSYHYIRNGLSTAIEWVDTLRTWGEKTQHTAEKVNDALNKAQEQLQQ